MDVAELYMDYHQKIYRYCCRQTHDPFLADDLTSQTFLRALEAMRRDKGPHTHISGWLFRIAHNLVIDYRKAKRFRQHMDLDLIFDLRDPAQDPEPIAERNETARNVRGLLRMLKPEHVRVITLHDLEGYRMSEVARMVGKRVGAVKGDRNRAMRLLRQRVRGELGTSRTRVHMEWGPLGSPNSSLLSAAGSVAVSHVTEPGGTPARP